MTVVFNVVLASFPGYIWKANLLPVANSCESWSIQDDSDEILTESDPFGTGWQTCSMAEHNSLWISTIKQQSISAAVALKNYRTVIYSA